MPEGQGGPSKGPCKGKQGTSRNKKQDCAGDKGTRRSSRSQSENHSENNQSEKICDLSTERAKEPGQSPVDRFSGDLRSERFPKGGEEKGPVSDCQEEGGDRARPRTQISRQSILLASSELGSCDEVKVWTEEGEEESEMTCSERLQAELQDDPGGGPPLIPIDPPDPLPSPPTQRDEDFPGKLEPCGSPFTPPSYLGLPPGYPPGYPPPPHIGRGGSPLSPFLYPTDHLGSPPPAHMGSLPYNLDPHKGPVGFRSYPFSSQYGGYPVLSSDLTTCAISRFSASGLFSGSGAGFGSSLSPPPGHHGHGLGLPLLNQVKLEPGLEMNNKKDKKKPHIKKPLNAFMLYMKEMRPQVVAECTLKESAAINQILGRKWHALTREEQAKYYEQARKERQLHMQMYPGWSARDNYAQTKEPAIIFCLNPFNK